MSWLPQHTENFPPAWRADSRLLKNVHSNRNIRQGHKRNQRERELYLWSMLDGRLEALTAEETVGILAQGDGNWTKHEPPLSETLKLISWFSGGRNKSRRVDRCRVPTRRQCAQKQLCLAQGSTHPSALSQPLYKASWMNLALENVSSPFKGFSHSQSYVCVCICISLYVCMYMHVVSCHIQLPEPLISSMLAVIQSLHLLLSYAPHDF